MQGLTNPPASAHAGRVSSLTRPPPIPRTQKTPRLPGVLRNLVRPNLEIFQRIKSERVADRNVGGIPSLPHQHPACARRIVARIERVPSPAQICLEPARKVPPCPRRRSPNVAQVAGAI